jgi:hypothetical protein
MLEAFMARFLADMQDNRKRSNESVVVLSAIMVEVDFYNARLGN